MEQNLKLHPRFFRLFTPKKTNINEKMKKLLF